MTYEIIKIEHTPVGEIAYLLDTTQGRVLKVNVDDYTRAIAPVPTPAKPVFDMAPRAPGSPLRPDDVDLLPSPEEFAARRAAAQPQPEPQPAQEGAATQVPTRRAQSIIPPHMRGIFTDKDMPGAAMERRVV